MAEFLLLRQLRKNRNRNIDNEPSPAIIFFWLGLAIMSTLILIIDRFDIFLAIITTMAYWFAGFFAIIWHIDEIRE